MGKIALLAGLLGLLALSLWLSAFAWSQLDGAPIPLGGFLAMGLGIAISLALGFGLMALLFHSRRHGYDEPPRLEDRRGRR